MYICSSKLKIYNNLFHQQVFITENQSALLIPIPVLPDLFSIKKSWSYSPLFEFETSVLSMNKKVISNSDFFIERICRHETGGKNIITFSRVVYKIILPLIFYLTKSLKMTRLLFCILPLFFSFQLIGQDAPPAEETEFTEEQLMAMYRAYADSVESTFEYQTGTVTIKDGLATLNVPAGYKFLNGASSDVVLTDLWGNPPSDPGYGSLGMLFPENSSATDTNSVYAINITYTEEGYIDDSDAKDLDFDDLLETMQDDMVASNEYRKELGYETVDLVGWASEPFYDAANKKLHWAKDLLFEGQSEHTLNYNIRILGRKGYLELNVIGGMKELPQVKNDIGGILPSVEFNEGHRYEDFDSNIDKVAAVGIGGLIAGKVLAKAGILAKVGIFLAKFWKIAALAVVGAFAGIRKFFGGGRKEEEEGVA